MAFLVSVGQKVFGDASGELSRVTNRFVCFSSNVSRQGMQ
jgi:hypothetical protein